MFFSSILVLALAVSRLMLSIRVAIALINSAMLVNRVATAPNMTIIVGISMFMDSFLTNKPNRSLVDGLCLSWSRYYDRHFYKKFLNYLLHSCRVSFNYPMTV